MVKLCENTEVNKHVDVGLTSHRRLILCTFLKDSHSLERELLGKVPLRCEGFYLKLS